VQWTYDAVASCDNVKAAATKDGRDGDENLVSDACHDTKSDKVHCVSSGLREVEEVG